MMTSARLATVLMLLVAAPAFAQPGPEAPSDQSAPAAASTAAPHNEDWSNVSHINGQIVKVGERDDYLLTYKKTNISTNPIGWMFGFYGVSVSRALTPNIAVRVDANWMNIDNGNITGYELGGSLPIYFKRVYQGPFLEPGIIVRSLTTNYGCDSYSSGGSSGCSDTSTLVGPEVLFGYHWTFDSGLNVAMAIGAARDLSSARMSSSGGVQPAGYFRIGYAL